MARRLQKKRFAMPRDLELVLFEISLDPVSYLNGVRRARTRRPHYVVDTDVSHLHRRFRNYMAGCAL